MEKPRDVVETSRGTLRTKTFRMPDVQQRRAWLERAGKYLLDRCDRVARRLNPDPDEQAELPRP